MYWAGLQTHRFRGLLQWVILRLVLGNFDYIWTRILYVAFSVLPPSKLYACEQNDISAGNVHPNLWLHDFRDVSFPFITVGRFFSSVTLFLYTVVFQLFSMLLLTEWVCWPKMTPPDSISYCFTRLVTPSRTPSSISRDHVDIANPSRDTMWYCVIVLVYDFCGNSIPRS